MTSRAHSNHYIQSILIEKGPLSSSEVHKEITARGDKVALVTVKRALSELASKSILNVQGSGRSTAYAISARGRITADIDAKTYGAVDPDKRYGLSTFNFDLLPAFPSDPFSSEESERFNVATGEYRRRTASLPSAIQVKELERFIIELSWKSSKIEGNTYSLLDTEKLILENKEAVGHDPKEAIMILNHKEAFHFLLQEREHYTTLTRANLADLHKRLTQGLHVSMGLRHSPVGVTGSLYRPLDNSHQIQEALETLVATVQRMETPYARALVALLGISYIQPFEDGNKRSARLMANAILLAHHCAPLSYRSVDENDYREAVLAFYEINTIEPFRKIFVGQYEFAVHNYAVK